jgi:hypothetical protein
MSYAHTVMSIVAGCKCLKQKTVMSIVAASVLPTMESLVMDQHSNIEMRPNYFIFNNNYGFSVSYSVNSILRCC